VLILPIRVLRKTVYWSRSTSKGKLSVTAGGAMSSLSSLSLPRFNRREAFGLLALLTITAVSLAAGCGGQSAMTGPHLSGNTQVALVLTGTANDQLQEFDLEIQSLTLTDKAGNTVSLISSPQPTEFIHINGGIEPLLSVTVPQAIYTSATAVIGSAEFNCEVLGSDGGLDFDTYAYGYTPQANVTVNLPSPLTVTGENMGLLLNLDVSNSASFPACDQPNGIPTYAITPTFNLTAMTLSPDPTNASNGLVTSLNGQVSSINMSSNTFVVALPETENPRTISIRVTGATTYQGINNFSGLAAGTFVNLDGAIQPDSSLAATRIAAVETSATSLVTGPLMYVSAAEPALSSLWRQQQGALFPNDYVLGGSYFSFGSATFLISGQLSNLQDLPFSAAFSGSNMVAGQNLYLSTDSLENSGGFPYTPLTTVMLVPQVVNGTVSGVSNSGHFTVYTVTLADYDFFPAFAVQMGQATLLANPSQVEIYVDSSTQLLNSSARGAGSLARFYGVVFNDNGTLRMDCVQVNDGVALNPPMAPTAADRMVKGQVTVIHTGKIGASHHTIRRITPVA
jgi:hypothetical protein